MVPAVLMGFMSILSTILPVECGEKVSLGVTILLAQVVELLVLSDILPPSTADDFPIAGRLVISLIVLSSVSVFVCVFVSALYYTPQNNNVPKWIVCIISSRLMGALFIGKLDLKSCCTHNTKNHSDLVLSYNQQSSSNDKLGMYTTYK